MGYRFLRFPEGRAKALTFSYDDGSTTDIRLAEILDKNGLKGTFNLNSCYIGNEGKLTVDEMKEHLLSKGHEIALHGKWHLAPGMVSPIEGIKDALNCRLELEGHLGIIIRGMAYPDSGINVISQNTSAEKIKGYLGDLGIAYARTLGYDNDKFLLPDSWHEWIPSAHHDNPEIMNMITAFLTIDPKTGYNSKRSPKLFYIWGHSGEFEVKGNWEHFEKICERLSGRDDIWYATNIEIYDYVNAYYSLVWSADGRRVYNPTLMTIWFFDSGREYMIKSGELLSL